MHVMHLKAGPGPQPSSASTIRLQNSSTKLPKINRCLTSRRGDLVSARSPFLKMRYWTDLLD